jgi:hypothetical protein
VNGESLDGLGAGTMRIDGHHREWSEADETTLEQVLRFRDRVGGGQFWLCHDDGAYPAVAIRVSGDVADVHYFPFDGHPGFRALPSPSVRLDHGGGTTTLLYERCDPSSGEQSPSEFIVSVDAAVSLAREFFRTGSRPSGASWFEL